MSYRQGYPSSEPEEDIGRQLAALIATGQANAADITRGALPEPLFFRVTTIVVGPPPTFQIDIVNPLTGGFITLGVI